MGRNLNLTALGLGFLWVTTLTWTLGLGLSQTAWFFWSASFLFLPLWAVFSVAEYFRYCFVGAKNQPTQEKDRSGHSHDSLPRFLFFTSLMFLMSGLFHIVIGLFLALFLPVEPLSYFSFEGYNSHFNIELVYFHLAEYPALIPGFLLLKSTIILSPRGLRLKGHTCLRDGIFPFFAAVLAAAIFKSPDQSAFALVLFSSVVFLPWSNILGRDRFEKMTLKEPELQVPLRLPVTHLYKPKVSIFWGIAALTMALYLMSLSLFFADKIIARQNVPFVYPVLLALIGITVSLGFVFAGMNMLFAFRKVQLFEGHVSVHERAFLILIPKHRRWTSSLSEYTHVAALKQSGTSSSGRVSHYSVQLKHFDDAKKNIELYRAFHSDDYKQVAQNWENLLQLKSQP